MGQLCGEANGVRASQFGWSCPVLVRCHHAGGVHRATLWGLLCTISLVARADPLGKARVIIQRDLPPPAICVIVHWSSWKRVSLRYRTMQNLFLHCKSISMYKTFAARATICKPVASGNHMLL